MTGRRRTASVLLIVLVASLGVLRRGHAEELEPSGGTPSPRHRMPNERAWIDASGCLGDSGERLREALILEVANSEELVVLSDPPDTDQTGMVRSQTGSPGITITNCSWRTGSILVDVSTALEDGSALLSSEHRLDLNEVPPEARPRTAAVALLEWARTLRTAPGLRQHEAPNSAATTTRTTGTPPTAVTTPTLASQTRSRPQISSSKLIFQAKVGLLMSTGPTPLVPSVFGLLDTQIWRGIRASFGVHAAHFEPKSSYAQLSAWWTGAELALGYAWLPRAELSVWALTAIDLLALRGTDVLGAHGSSLSGPLFSAGLRFQARTVLDSGLVLGASCDAGGFIVGTRVTALGQPVASLSVFRGASAVFVGYAF